MSINREKYMFETDVLLYAEDDAAFVDILHCTLKQGGFNYQVVHVPDGEQAIAYLKGLGKYADRETYPLPSVLLLDLKMPRSNGFEVLQWVRQQSPFPYLPVVVLTVSEELRDISKAYALGANSFLIKPPSIADLRDMLLSLSKYWAHYNVPDDKRRYA